MRIGDTGTSDNLSGYRVKKIPTYKFFLFSILGVVMPITIYYFYKIIRTLYDLNSVKIKTYDYKIVPRYKSDKRYKGGYRVDGMQRETIGEGTRELSKTEKGILKYNLFMRIVALLISVLILTYIVSISDEI